MLLDTSLNEGCSNCIFNIALVNFFEHVTCAAENDNSRSSKTGDVADLPFLRISTKVSKHINLQPETDPVTPSHEVSALIYFSSSFKQ